MGKETYSIQELVGKIKRGEVRLPEIQRGYVWKGNQVRDLLDSLYRGYPSGTILTWQTSGEAQTRDFAVSQDKAKNQDYQLLLDGQQRLTSLFAIIRGASVTVRDRKRPIDILFNLEHPDEPIIATEIDDEPAEDDEENEAESPHNMTFAVKKKQLEQLPHWVAVTNVFRKDDNKDLLKEAGVSNWDDPKHEKYNRRLNQLRKIREYNYDVTVIEREKSYEEVTEIFVRVNSRGTKLRGSDLALAQITAKWEGSLKIFEEFQEKCTNYGFNLDLGIFVRNLVSFATKQSQFRTVSKISPERLKEAWELSKRGFEYAMDFLKSNVGIDSSTLFSSPSILIAIAYFAHCKNYTLHEEDERKLRYWTLIANAKGRYSRGASETMLDQDLASISKDESLDSLIGLLRSQTGSLKIQEADLENKDSRSPYFKTMFILFRKDGAKDWGQRLVISLNHSGHRHKLQFHHIFPKSVLKDEEKIDDICNLAFISGRTNREISNSHPSAYLSEIVETQGEEALTLQQIPTSPDLWDLSNYDAFLKARRKMVVDRLNQFLDHQSIGLDEDTT